MMFWEAGLLKPAGMHYDFLYLFCFSFYFEVTFSLILAFTLIPFEMNKKMRKLEILP